LETLDVEVGAGQVAFLGALVDDAEWHLLVGVVQEDRLRRLDRSLRPVDRTLRRNSAASGELAWSRNRCR
jgi:hypothetical protein